MTGDRSKELLRLEHKNTPFSPLETTLLVCDNNKESNTQTKRLPIDGTPFTAPLPPSQLLGKVKDFLGVMSEANKRLEHDAKDHPEKYDFEELTGNESEVIEMDLMLGVADLHTPEAVAAAESAVSSCQPVISLAADGSEIDSEEESGADDDNEDAEIDSNVDGCDYGNDGCDPSVTCLPQSKELWLEMILTMTIRRMSRTLPLLLLLILLRQWSPMQNSSQTFPELKFLMAIISVVGMNASSHC